jgi:hypothetical protein
MVSTQLQRHIISVLAPIAGQFTPHSGCSPVATQDKPGIFLAPDHTVT